MPKPIYVQLTRQEAANLIATLAAQLAGVGLPFQCVGATTSAFAESGERVVVFYAPPAAKEEG